MTDTSSAQTSDVRRLESEIAHLFSFALGAVAGYNAAKQPDQRLPFEELPQGYSFAGGKLDSMAGDLALRANRNNWYLIEMKRDFAALRTELCKQRVTLFLDSIDSPDLPDELVSLLDRARAAHLFLYLGRPTDRSHPELATLSYLEWGTDVRQNSGGAHAKTCARPFSSHLAQMSNNSDGFTLEQLSLYIHWLNSAPEESGTAGSSEIYELIAVATDSKTGALDLINATTLMEIVQKHAPKQSSTFKQVYQGQKNRR